MFATQKLETFFHAIKILQRNHIITQENWFFCKQKLSLFQTCNFFDVSHNISQNMTFWKYAKKMQKHRSFFNRIHVQMLLYQPITCLTWPTPTFSVPNEKRACPKWLLQTFTQRKNEKDNAYKMNNGISRFTTLGPLDPKR